ncbi:MAG: LPP20 family lipoprotein [Sulfuricurvum sp.]|uniref:LPP20 family lipoprotein n=1 Tax=Sulfuricurvum sp. TaxID=2025608 RepID=UPI0025FA8D4E|nr:LPP20 family lipoprotein [Sulfuricurvum sp.]MBV5321445.1 LPP20 family lipoprotein [Sulfuricurvum sp.]
MRISALLALLLTVPALNAGFFNSDASSDTKVKCVYSGTDGHCVEPILKSQNELVITVTGQGIAPSVTASPAQAYALAKRAAMVDGYRLIAERVKGVQVEGQDTIKNMMLQQSSTKTSVEALVRGANVTNTSFKEGLCEVEMEIALSYSRVLH